MCRASSSTQGPPVGPSVCSSGVRPAHPWKVGLSHRRTAPGSCKFSSVFHLFTHPVSRQTNRQISHGSVPAPLRGVPRWTCFTGAAADEKHLKHHLEKKGLLLQREQRCSAEQVGVKNHV